MPAKKKEPEALPVRNVITLVWRDDDDNVHEYNKRLVRPRGRAARLFMPKVLAFLGRVSDVYDSVESEGERFSSQTKLIEEFFTEANEDLFIYILQLENDSDGLKALDQMNNIDVLEVVIYAAQYLVAESLNRTEVQAALKKSDGEEPEEVEPPPA